jgi:hypothetical protein
MFSMATARPLTDAGGGLGVGDAPLDLGHDQCIGLAVLLAGLFEVRQALAVPTDPDHECGGAPQEGDDAETDSGPTRCVGHQSGPRVRVSSGMAGILRKRG